MNQLQKSLAQKGAAFATFVYIALFPVTTLAHERWFIHPSEVGETPQFFRTFGIHLFVIAGIIILLLVLSRAIDHALRRAGVGRPIALLFSRAKRITPTLIGVTTSIVLFWVALNRALLAPHLVLPDSQIATIIVIAELVIAALLIMGLFTRVAAGLLIILVVWSLAQFGYPAIENIFYLGVAIYLLVWGRGRFSLGAVFSSIVFAMDTGHVKPVALSILRILTGGALLWGGIDKLVHPEFYLQMLSVFSWNPLTIIQQMLPQLTSEWYVLFIATIEIFFALLLIFGWLLRPVALVLFFLFISATVFMNTQDLIGHLPYLAVFFTLFLLGKSIEKTQRLI